MTDFNRRDVLLAGVAATAALTGSGLFQALLDEHLRLFQDAFMFGPPPLGPGAPAEQRHPGQGRERHGHDHIFRRRTQSCRKRTGCAQV